MIPEQESLLTSLLPWVLLHSMQQFGPRMSVARRQLEQSFATTATAARVALSQTVQMAEIVNQRAKRVSNALGIP